MKVTAKVTVKMENLLRKASQAAKTEKAAFEKISARVIIAEQEMMETFNKHKVTQELEAGPNLEGSDILGVRGNLFSFIGFPKGRKPIQEVRQLLHESIKIKSPKPLKFVKNKWFFTVTVPHLSEMESETPLPWESGRSWLRGIERGISGLGYYMFSRNKLSGVSRSGTAIQSQVKFRSGFFRNRKYMSSFIRTFYKRIGVIGAR